MYLISMIIRETQCRQVLLVIRAYLPLVCRSYKETCSSDLAAQNHVEHSSGSSAFIKEPGSRQTSSALSHFLSRSFTWRKQAISIQHSLRTTFAFFIITFQHQEAVLMQSIMSEQQGSVHNPSHGVSSRSCVSSKVQFTVEPKIVFDNIHTFVCSRLWLYGPTTSAYLWQASSQQQLWGS